MKKIKVFYLIVVLLVLFVSGAKADKVEDVCAAIADAASIAYNAGYAGEDCSVLAYTAMQAVGPGLKELAAVVGEKFCIMGRTDRFVRHQYRGIEAWHMANSACLGQFK